MEHIGRYLRDIYFCKKKGQLVFRQNKIQKYLFFQEGQLVYAKTNREDELLGEILFRLGKLTEEVYNNIEEYIEPMEIIGQVLLKRGLLSKEDLMDGLLYQMREIALNIFPVFEGKFRFQEREDLQLADFDINISIPVLIADGIRRMKFDSNIKKFLIDQTISTKERGFLFQLTEEEKEILEKIKDNSSPKEILKETGFDPEKFWKSLYLFYCLDLIRLDEAESVLDSEKEPAAQPEGKDEARKIEDVLDFHQRIQGLNYYQILDIPKSAPADEVKKAYFLLARQYHPDLFNRKVAASQKDVIDEVFNQISRAYKTLSDESKREDYDKTIAESEAPAHKGIEKQAEKKFRQAKTLYNMGRYEEAVSYLEEAIRMDAHKSSYYLLLGMVEGKISDFHKKAEEHFNRAIGLEPWNPDGYLGLGLLYKNAGLKIKAANQFRKVLRFDSSNEAAIRELQSLEGKSFKGGLKALKNLKDLKGLVSFDVKNLKDLFGKKKK
ncbi:MAG: DnaJ domain-containing protein [Candidatus Aminicenantes bacterium]|nr:DnaJ domain-containing protein [Candidatus Aminicenantes bacterium]